VLRARTRYQFQTLGTTENVSERAFQEAHRWQLGESGSDKASKLCSCDHLTHLEPELIQHSPVNFVCALYVIVQLAPAFPTYQVRAVLTGVTCSRHHLDFGLRVAPHELSSPLSISAEIPIVNYIAVELGHVHAEEVMASKTKL
jgi:hypothetical protein